MELRLSYLLLFNELKELKDVNALPLIFLL